MTLFERLKSCETEKDMAKVLNPYVHCPLCEYDSLECEGSKDCVSGITKKLQKEQSAGGDFEPTDKDYTATGEIEVYLGANCQPDKLIDPLENLMMTVWKKGGGFLDDCLRVKVRAEYIPENK